MYKKPVYKNVYSDDENPELAKQKARIAEREWKDLCEELEERGVLTDQRKRIIDRLVRERVEFEVLAPRVAREGAIKKGPNGGEYFSYEWSALQKVKDQILKLEEALKLIVPKADEVAKKPNRSAPAQKFLDRLGSN